MARIAGLLGVQKTTYAILTDARRLLCEDITREEFAYTSYVCDLPKVREYHLCISILFMESKKYVMNGNVKLADEFRNCGRMFVGNVNINKIITYASTRPEVKKTLEDIPCFVRLSREHSAPSCIKLK